MLKRVAILLFCLLITFVATFGFVVGVVAVPTIYSYAAVNDDSIYTPLRETSDLVDCFQSYCKSRDLTIEGSLTDAVTTFTTGAFNSACNEIGINITQLQAEIKAEYDQSGKPVKFLMNESGVMAMNRIFAQFLQDNELQVGDQNVNKNVYNGKYFVDDLGNKCLPTVLSTDGYSHYDNFNHPNIVVQPGTPFVKPGFADALTFAQEGSSRHYVDFRFNDNLYYIDSHIPSDGYDVTAVCVNAYAYACYYTTRRSGSDTNIYLRCKIHGGYPTIFTFQDSTSIGYGILNTYTDDYGNGTKYYGFTYQIMQSAQLPNVTINIVSTTINNNNYEGDTIINNDGDVIVEPEPTPPGGKDPGWDVGGGEGTATDKDGNTINIQFPDFELPDLNIDWSINGLGEKFPFSIPFDLVALVTVLNAEPQAPRFEGTVNFGFTTWDYDINLDQFDTVASACRIAELLLLVIGLILITRSIIKG